MESMRLIEQLSEALEEFPHEKYLEPTLQSLTHIGIAIPSGCNPLAIVICASLDDFIQDYETIVGVEMGDTLGLATYVLSIGSQICRFIKSKRKDPVLCIGFFSSSEKLDWDLIREFMDKEGFDEIFQEGEMEELKKFLRNALSNPNYPVKVFEGKRGREIRYYKPLGKRLAEL